MDYTQFQIHIGHYFTDVRTMCISFLVFYHYLTFTLLITLVGNTITPFQHKNSGLTSHMKGPSAGHLSILHLLFSD